MVSVSSRSVLFWFLFFFLTISTTKAHQKNEKILYHEIHHEKKENVEIVVVCSGTNGAPRDGFFRKVYSRDERNTRNAEHVHTREYESYLELYSSRLIETTGNPRTTFRNHGLTGYIHGLWIRELSIFPCLPVLWQFQTLFLFFCCAVHSWVELKACK